MFNLPAHQTKHESSLAYTLPSGTNIVLAQEDALIDSTGRTVWLGAQVLAVYLHDTLGRARGRKTAIELGAGCGLLSLSLFSQGYDTLATDLDFIVNGVLRKNAEENEVAIRREAAGEAKLNLRTLDWFETEEWTWEQGDGGSAPPFDLIVTADTVYDPGLSQPLLRSLHTLASLSPSALVYLALEARDPILVAAFLASASTDWSFKTSRVDHSRLKKLVESKEGTLGWEDEMDWEGIEVWKLKLSKVKEKRKRNA